MLHADFDDSPAQKNPERALWAHCLSHAINRALHKDRMELNWLFADHDAKRIGSYLWICNALDIHPSRIRNWVTEQLRTGGARHFWHRAN